MGCSEFTDLRQAEEAYQQWRKEHPEEAAASDKLWEECKKDPEIFKRVMWSKGFTFPDNKSTETVAAKKWRKRALDWLKKKEKPEKTVKLFRRLAIVYAGSGSVLVAAALWTIYTLAMEFAAGKPYTTLDPSKLPELIYGLGFLVMVNTLAGSMLFMAGLLIIFSITVYAFSLEKRIKILEKKQQPDQEEQH